MNGSKRLRHRALTAGWLLFIGCGGLAANDPPIAIPEPETAPAAGHDPSRPQRGLLRPGAAAVGGRVAADPITDKPVPVFTVRPQMRFPAVMPPAAPGTRKPIPPEPLDPKRRTALFEQTFAAPAGETVTLSARQPIAADLGHLVFDQPHRFDPVHGVAFTDEPAGSASIGLLAKPGVAYLLDFSVNSWAEGVYSVAADGESTQVADDGHLKHVLAGVKAGAGGWITVRLSRTGGGFYLHAVAVTTSAPAK